MFTIHLFLLLPIKIDLKLLLCNVFFQKILFSWPLTYCRIMTRCIYIFEEVINFLVIAIHLCINVETKMVK